MASGWWLGVNGGGCIPVDKSAHPPYYSPNPDYPLITQLRAAENRKSEPRIWSLRREYGRTIPKRAAAGDHQLHR